MFSVEVLLLTFWAAPLCSTLSGRSSRDGSDYRGGERKIASSDNEQEHFPNETPARKQPLPNRWLRNRLGVDEAADPCAVLEIAESNSNFSRRWLQYSRGVEHSSTSTMENFWPDVEGRDAMCLLENGIFPGNGGAPELNRFSYLCVCYLSVRQLCSAFDFSVAH